MLDSLVRVSRRVLKVPKAIASQIGVSTRSVREHLGEQPPGDGTGTRSDHHTDGRACRGPNANCVAAPRHLYTVERADRETPRVRPVRRTVRTDSTAGLRPAPNGSRRPTGGEVHAI